jgi:hypothetical protein
MLAGNDLRINHCPRTRANAEKLKKEGYLPLVFAVCQKEKKVR